MLRVHVSKCSLGCMIWGSGLLEEGGFGVAGLRSSIDPIYEHRLFGWKGSGIWIVTGLDAESSRIWV